MKQNLPSLNEIERSETNPFMVNLKGKMYLQPRANTIIARGEVLVSKDTGEELQDTMLIGRRKIVDKSTFAKIYASEVGILFELSKAAMKVFLHLTKVMDYDNKAIFNQNKEYAKLGYKGNTVPLNGLRELIGKGLIYPHTQQGIWWINPAVVCKGERFAKYTEFVVEGEGVGRKREKAMLHEQNKRLTNKLSEDMGYKYNINNGEDSNYKETRDDQNNPIIRQSIEDYYESIEEYYK